ncbi:hypothetical protein [Erythrobacter sp. EC-HK427]|uniref:hypothetical protein n=1 Tax=Erythrobacter sp. EC-HK427 TaxID=2038396 RepID=UPI0012566D07|nr:hypothetical protein [Erythrobacter sp. EC-HK427]VVT12210.1 hypothetical protein ERY430_60213 [Erythrobacter sp. EC-HK427]
MHVALIAPIRTLINLDTELAHAHPRQFSALLKHICETSGDSVCSTMTTDKRADVETDFTKYTSLDADYGTWFAEPLVRIDFAGERASVLEAQVEARLTEDQCGAQAIESAQIQIFDNTLAIVVLHLFVRTDRITGFARTPGELERYLTHYAAEAAAVLQTVAIEPYLRRFLAVQADPQFWPHRRTLLKRPREFVAFKDISTPDYPVWDPSRSSLMWAHRVFDLSSCTLHERELIRPALRAGAVANTKGYSVGWGNTVLERFEEPENYIALCCAVQHFYCLVDIIGSAQRRLYRSVVASSSARSFRDYNRVFDRLEIFRAETSSEFADFQNGLQDRNRAIFDDIANSFTMPDLVQAIDTKSAVIKERLSRMALANSAVSQRVSSVAILLLGVIEIVSLVHNIYWYSQDVHTAEGNTDPVYGVTDLAHATSFDLVFNITAILVLLAIPAWIFFKRDIR